MAILEPLKIVEKGIDSNLYRICHLVVQRARELQGGVPSLVPTDYKKPTSQALEEMLDGKLSAYTDEEWAEVEAKRAAGKIPAPYEPVAVEGASTPAEDLGGFTGFLNSVMRAEPKAAAGRAKSDEADDDDEELLDEDEEREDEDDLESGADDEDDEEE